MAVTENDEPKKETPEEIPQKKQKGFFNQLVTSFLGYERTPFVSRNKITEKLVKTLNYLLSNKNNFTDESSHVLIQKFVTDIEAALKANKGEKLQKVIEIFRRELPAFVESRKMPETVETELSKIEKQYVNIAEKGRGSPEPTSAAEQANVSKTPEPFTPSIPNKDPFVSDKSVTTNLVDALNAVFQSGKLQHKTQQDMLKGFINEIEQYAGTSEKTKAIVAAEKLEDNLSAMLGQHVAIPESVGSAIQKIKDDIQAVKPEKPPKPTKR